VTNKTIAYDNNEIMIRVEGFELYDIDEIDMEEPEGDHFIQEYTKQKFTHALRDYLKLIDQNWKSVELYIHTKPKNGVSTTLRLSPNLHLWSSIDIDTVNSEALEKLTQIHELSKP
jgi:hypothetical protein